MFNEYPYVNLQDVNLDWILKQIKELETNLQDFVKLNTIKYADPIIWNITKQYETNTVVIDGNTGTAYLSVQPVPAGVALTNTDYWTVIFTLNLTTSNQNITFRDDGTNVVATFASDTGDWLLWNFYLYRVTQPISVNTAYLEGFNIERFSVELFIRDYINTLTNVIGDLDDLETSDKTSIVAAINDLLSTLSGVIGDLDDLETSDKTSIVAAINNLLSTLSDKIGDLQDLDTTDKSSIVAAINNLLSTLSGVIGDLEDLDTSDKTSIVNAINSVIEDMPSLAENYYKITPDMSVSEIKDVVLNYNNVYFAPGEYSYSLTGENDAFIIARSNMNIWIDGDLKLNANNYGTGNVLSIDQCENVNVFGNGTLNGDKLIHTGTTGEWGHVLNITNSKNIHVESLRILTGWGDGIYVGGYLGSESVYITNVICDDNRRNAISVVSAKNVYVVDSIFRNTSGTAPQAGIAVETNSDSPYLDSIFFVNCTSVNNTGAPAYATTHVSGSVVFIDCSLIGEGKDYGVAFATLTTTANANFYLNGCYVSGLNGVAVGINSISKVLVRNTILEAIRTSAIVNTSATLNASFFECFVRNSTIAEGFIKSINNSITNSTFIFNMFSSTVNDVRRIAAFNNDSCDIKVNGNVTPITMSSGAELWSCPTMIYDSSSASGGMTQMDLRYCILSGMIYRIINTSAQNLNLLLPAGSVKNNFTTAVLPAGGCLIAQRVNASLVIFTMYTT